MGAAQWGACVVPWIIRGSTSASRHLGGDVVDQSNDRRGREKVSSAALKRELNEDQLATLNTLERFGWELKFIRREPGGKLAILFDPDAHKYAVLGLDGEVDENPGFHQFR